MECIGARNFAAMAVSPCPSWTSRRRRLRTKQAKSMYKYSNSYICSLKVSGSAGSESCVAFKEEFADEEDFIKAGGSELVFVQMQQKKDMDKQSKLSDKLPQISVGDVLDLVVIKNFIRRNIDGDSPSSGVNKEFKDGLMRALLQAEPAVLKVLVEAFRIIVVSEFVKKTLWPELVPELQSVIWNSNLIHQSSNCQWKTINALTVLHALLRPFQYFLNPKVAKEPVPSQLELITKEILAPLLGVFHQFVEKALNIHGGFQIEVEKILLIMCKCIHFAVKSHMPSSLPPLLHSFCHDLFRILGSLRFDGTVALEDEYLLRLKTGKRSLLIFCSLITRHRKYSDKLMPDIINCVLNVVKFTNYIGKLDFLSERVVSLGFDVISHVLETGPGWRLVSAHFSSLLDSAIFPALVMNEKDIIEWEEDADEYMRRNLPSDLEEISGWREDLFTARKSAINLLGVLSMSKGPPVVPLISSSLASKRKKSEKKKGKDQSSSVGELLVLPFLSKFPIPSDASVSQTSIINEYYGVLMAYGGLQDFLREQKPEYTTNLLCTRVLPLYTVSVSIPYLLATASWVLGELASCLPEEMSADAYSALMKALAMPDKDNISCYPVRISAAGAITALLENDYLPPEWLPLLQAVVSRIGNDDEESSILYQLLSSVMEAGSENVAVHIPDIVSSLAGAISKCLPPNLEPWPQVVENGFMTLAVMAQTWEGSMPGEIEQNNVNEEKVSGQTAIARTFSLLLQQAWLSPVHQMEGQVSLPPSCIDYSSTLLRFIMQSVTGNNEILELKVSELLLTWADLIADWHAWEESEDLSIFDCIKEVVTIQEKFGLMNFIVGKMPPPPAPPVPQLSIFQSIGIFVSEAISQYPSATWRACSCVHNLLNVPSYYPDGSVVKYSLVKTFSMAAFTRFRDVQSKPCSLWKPLVLAISSCYLVDPDFVEDILEKDDIAAWASALGLISTSTFEPALSTESEIKLVVLALAKVVERLSEQQNQGDLLRYCFTSLLEASVRLKEVEEENEEDEEAEDDEDDDDDVEHDTEDDEDSEDFELEETEEQFLDRYAKAALALENGTVEEGDVEDQDQDPELGSLEEADHENVVRSLLETYHQVLINVQGLPPQLISSFLNTFPDYTRFFQQSR